MNVTSYEIINIPRDAPEADEPLGTKTKFWYGGRKYLFKAARAHTGEDWAELISAEIANRLGLPHAEYDLARWEGARRIEEQHGVRSKNFCPSGAALVLGNELLTETQPDYQAIGVSKFRVSAHTVERVATVIRKISPQLPLDWPAPPGIVEAFDVFVGYLLIDVLVGNTDRHDENWGIVKLANGNVHLAPTFDHASSLGCHLQDDNRTERLRTKDRNRTVCAYAAKARSAFYDTEFQKTPLLTLDAFMRSAQRKPSAGIHWLNALENLDHGATAKMLNSIPHERISSPAIDFARQLLAMNTERLLQIKKQLQ